MEKWHNLNKSSLDSVMNIRASESCEREREPERYSPSRTDTARLMSQRILPEAYCTTSFI